eukprot:gene3421-6788_t
MSVSKEYSPDIISQSFIKQYYDMFARNPGELHRFYKEDSNFIHGEGHQVADVINGVENIREKVNQLELAGARVDLSEGSIDAQKSENNGVFLTVTGRVTLVGKPTRPFVQCFYLASQNSQKGSMVSYFVRNSVFRLLGETNTESHIAEKTLMTEPITTIPSTTMDTASSAVSVEAEACASMNDVVSEPIHYQNEEVTVEEAYVVEQQEVEVEVEPVVPEEEQQDTFEEQEASHDITVESTHPRVPSPPKSFADIVRRLGGEKPAPATATSTSPPAPAPRAARNAPKKEKVRSEEAIVDNASNAAGSGTNNTGGTSKNSNAGLFVNQIHEDTTHEDLLEIFTTFGEVKQADVHASRGYAFIEYIDVTSARMALAQAEIEPFVVKGQTIKIEERQTKSRGKGQGQGQGQGHSTRGSGEGGGGRGGGGGGGRGGGRFNNDNNRHRNENREDAGDRGEGQNSSTRAPRKEGGRGRGPRPAGYGVGPGPRGGGGGSEHHPQQDNNNNNNNGNKQQQHPNSAPPRANNANAANKK